MQNLYMVATIFRQEQMQQMVNLINTNQISVNEAMERFNVATEDAVRTEVTRFNLIAKRRKAVKQAAISFFSFPKSFKWAVK